jgi:hypothetical protein
MKPEFKKVIWNAPERVTDTKLKQMSDNYHIVRGLYERSPKRVVSIERSTTPLKITTNDQVIQTCEAELFIGRAYRIKAVNNNAIWGSNTTYKLYLQLEGVTKAEEYVKGITQGAGILDDKIFDAPMPLEFLYFPEQNETVTVDLKIVNPAGAMGAAWWWKLNTPSVESNDLEDIYENMSSGDYYIIVEDIGVRDI